ncbi:MAG: alkyl hydroperoxide reductase/Thiol specific antioxidant/Mal allergen [Hyphomicrobiales bacterium]|nr:alkyl hydroperoxide reductase/Thiol specific antioxidant/Mal allergen [Hyphomicrobiales bacterium]
MTLKLETGVQAPPFDLPSDGNGRVNSATLAGKKYVLYFYPKDDTSGCTQEAIEFNGLRKEFEAARTIVLGVSPDSGKSHDKFKAKHGLEFGLVSDEEKSMLQAYGVWVEKSMYGRKYMGVERTTVLVGTDGRIAQVWNKVKVPGHAKEVLEAARALRMT